MFKNKNGEVKSQIHLYCNPKLYKDFKEAVKQYNKTAKENNSISEIIRVLMMEFIKNSSNDSENNIKVKETENNTNGGV